VAPLKPFSNLAGPFPRLVLPPTTISVIHFVLCYSQQVPCQFLLVHFLNFCLKKLLKSPEMRRFFKLRTVRQKKRFVIVFTSTCLCIYFSKPIFDIFIHPVYRLYKRIQIQVRPKDEGDFSAGLFHCILHSASCVLLLGLVSVYTRKFKLK
jgi:hypothetical protein